MSKAERKEWPEWKDAKGSGPFNPIAMIGEAQYTEARAAVNCMDEVRALVHKVGGYSATHRWLSGKPHTFNNMGRLSCPICEALAALKEKVPT